MKGEIMNKERSNFSNKLGFVLAAAGSAVICTNLIKILAFVTCPFFVFQQKNPQNTQERHPQKEG